MAEVTREEQDLLLGESFESLDFWQNLRGLAITQFKEIQVDINNKLNKIDNDINNRIKGIETDLNDKLKDISEKISFISELKKTFNDELVNLNNLNDVLKEFKTTKVIINNPTYDDLIMQLKEMLFSEAKEDNNRFNKYIDTKNNLLNQLIAERVSDLEKLANKAVESTNSIVNNFNQFSDSMKKGNDSILSSEIIVGKLLYSLRFIEKLSPDIQEKLLTFSKSDFENIAKYINENKSNNEENSKVSSHFIDEIVGGKRE